MKRSESAPDVSALARALAARAIGKLALPHTDRIVIGVAGESGSGKSVTATALSHELASGGIPATVLHQDDYFLLPPRTNHEHRVRDLGNVGPHEVNLALLQAHVDAFRAGRDGVDGPAVDYPANRFATKQHDFSRVAALIVEGTYVFRLRDIDLRVFLEATHVETRDRRRVRNRDIDAPIIDQILAIEHDLIAPQAAQADILIDREFAIRPGR